MKSRFATTPVFFVFLLIAVTAVFGQGTLADYERATGLQAKFQGLTVDMPGTPNWIGRTNHFWFSRTVKGGTRERRKKR